MKIIEAMKRVKANKEKVVDLQGRIGQHCANLSHETPVYGKTETTAKINEWLQACDSLSQDNIRLLVAIARTNLATPVTIDISGKPVTKTIAEWVWRRREYAATDMATWGRLGDRGLKEGQMPSTVGTPTEIKIVRHFDPVKKDEMVGMYRAEPHEIDAALEVINAVTELIE